MCDTTLASDATFQCDVDDDGQADTQYLLVSANIGGSEITSVVQIDVPDAESDLITSDITVTALGSGLERARDLAYRACSLISFDGMHHRTDIAGGGSA